MNPEMFMDVLITPTSYFSDFDTRWVAHATLQHLKEPASVVELQGWPTLHQTKRDADLAALATAKRRIHGGRWKEQNEDSGFLPLEELIK